MIAHIRLFSLRFLLLSLFTALLYSVFTPAYAAPTSAQCTLTDVHNLIADWRGDNELLVEGFKKFGETLFQFEIIEARLSSQCDGVQSHLTRVEKFRAVLEPASHIPTLKALIKPVQQIGERLNIVVLKKPHDTLCKTTVKIRSKIDNIATKYKKSPIVKGAKAFDASHLAVADALKLYADAGGNPTNCVSLNKLCAAAREASDLQRKLLDEIEELLHQSEPVSNVLQTINNGVTKATDFIDDIFDGDVGKVINGVSNLMDKSISLPIPRGAKERGVGVIPKCCPGGYSLQGGLCYKNCRSGYAPVLFTCVEKCKSGWTDIGVTCTRTVKKKVGFIKIPVPQFDAKHSYTRSGKVPASFGNAACSCRRDKRYLEAGLCYNKCGRDHLAGYRTSFLTQCLDLRPTTLTIADLAENLNVFEKAKQIPGLGSAIKGVERLIDQAFSALTGPISKALKVPQPPLRFPTDIPAIPLLDKLAEVVNVDILRHVDELSAALLRDTSCRNNV